MKPNEASFDPIEFDKLAVATVPGYAALQELVALAAAVGVAPEGNVLDVGCGTGSGLLTLARALPNATLVACDPVLPMVNAARARCAEARIDARIEHGTIDTIGEGAAFDVIVSTLVMHFIPIDLRVAWLRAIQSRLRPGGRLILTALTRDAEQHTDERWAQLRKQYATNQGFPLDALAKRQAQTQMDPVRESDLRGQITAAGFRTVMPLVQLLAVKCWHIGD